MDDDNVQIQSPSHLVFGNMGVATFILFFFLIVIVVVWIFTSPCPTPDRITIRGVTFAVFGLIMVILAFANKEPRYIGAHMEPHIYDLSIIPRVAVCIIMSIFGIVAVINLIDHFGESKQLSSVNQDVTALWQE